MYELMGNTNTSGYQQIKPFGPQLPSVGAVEVNDDPAQILDVLTLSEQEGEQSGAEIDVARFVYEPTQYSVGSDVLDRLLADDSSDMVVTEKKERDPHEHN